MEPDSQSLQRIPQKKTTAFQPHIHPDRRNLRYTRSTTIHSRKELPISGNVHKFPDRDKRDKKHQYRQKA